MEINELLERVIVQNEMIIGQDMELPLVQSRGYNCIFFEQDNLISSLNACPIPGAKNVGVRDAKMEFIDHIPVIGSRDIVREITSRASLQAESGIWSNTCELRSKTMPESVLTKPVEIEKENAAPASGTSLRRSSKAFNSFQIAQAQFDKVAEYLGLDQPTKDLPSFPLREYQFAIPVRMDVL